MLFRHDGSETMEENIVRLCCRCFLYLAGTWVFKKKNGELWDLDASSKVSIGFVKCSVELYSYF